MTTVRSEQCVFCAIVAGHTEASIPDRPRTSEKCRGLDLVSASVTTINQAVRAV